jgi:hypothetical protein
LVTLVAPIPTCIAERVVFIINHLCGVIGEHGRTDRASVPLLDLTCQRLRRLRSGLTRLIAAFREGRLAPPRVRPRREPPPGPAEPSTESPESDAEAGVTPPGPPAQAEQLRLPSKFGWLLRFGWRAAGARSQFEHWLQDPEAQALLAASRQARRIVRRLCHMLGIELPEALRLPPRPRRKRRRAGAATARAATGKPTKAEIKSWMPGQKRPMPWEGRRRAQSDPWLLMRPEPKIA